MCVCTRKFCWYILTILLFINLWYAVRGLLFCYGMVLLYLGLRFFSHVHRKGIAMIKFIVTNNYDVTPLVQLLSPKLTVKAITHVVTKILALAIRPKSAHSLSLVLR